MFYVTAGTTKVEKMYIMSINLFSQMKSKVIINMGHAWSVT